MSSLPNKGFIIGTSNAGERNDRSIAYDLFAHAAVGLDLDHIDNSFLSLGNPAQPLVARWALVRKSLSVMRTARRVQLLSSDWAFCTPVELFNRGFDLMRVFLVLEHPPPISAVLDWLKYFRSSQVAMFSLIRLCRHGDNYVGWCGQIWKDTLNALNAWNAQWIAVPNNQAAQAIAPLSAHPLVQFMRLQVRDLAVPVADIIRHHGLLEIVHLEPWYKVMTRVFVPNAPGQLWQMLSEYRYPLRGYMMREPYFCWRVTPRPLARIPSAHRPVAAPSAGIHTLDEQDLLLNPSIIITLANRCHVTMTTILPWNEGRCSLGSSSATAAPGTVVMFRLGVGLYVELPADLVRDVATVRIDEVIAAVRHAGGEVRADPNNKGRFKIVLRQTVARVSQAAGGLGPMAAFLFVVTTLPSMQLWLEMDLVVNYWGGYNAVSVRTPATALADTWPMVVGRSDLLGRFAIFCLDIPLGNLWTGGTQWTGPFYRPPPSGEAWCLRKMVIMLLESASLFNLAGLLWLAFNHNLEPLAFVVVGANAIGELSSRLLACIVSERQVRSYLGALLSPVTWTVFDEGVRVQFRGRFARGVLLLEAVPGVVGLGAALVGVGFREVWSEVVIGIVAVASFLGSWGVTAFMQEVLGNCECLYDAEEMLVQSSMLYMTALVVEVAVLGPLVASDWVALMTLIFGILEALVATYAIHRFVRASARIRSAIRRGASVTLPTPLSVRVGNLVTGNGLTLTPTHEVLHCQSVAYGNGSGAVEHREVVMGIGANGVPVEVPIHDVLGVVSTGRLSHVGSYTQTGAQSRLIKTNVNVLHWSGGLPPAAYLAPVGSSVLLLVRSGQSDPSFNIVAYRNVNLEQTCCQPPLPMLQGRAPVRYIAAAAVRLSGGTVLPYGANERATDADGAWLR